MMVISRVRHLRPDPDHRRLGGSLTQEPRQVFDPTAFASFQVWQRALDLTTVPLSGGYTKAAPETTLRLHRSALIAALGPVLHDVAEVYRTASNDCWTTREMSEKEKKSLSGIGENLLMDYQNSVIQTIRSLVDDALERGLFDEVVALVVGLTQGSKEPQVIPTFNRQQTPVIDGDRVPLWSKLPMGTLGPDLLQALLDHPSLDDRLARLAHPTSQGVFDGWQRETALAMYSNSSAEVLTAESIGRLVARITAQPTLIEQGRSVIMNVLRANDLGSVGNPITAYFSTRVARSLSHAYPRFDQAPAELFEILPLRLWMGIARNVTKASKMGSWIADQAMVLAHNDPSGYAAESLCVQAWLTLDKKRILALEAALPGISRLHLNKITQDGRFAVDLHRANLVFPPELPSARWAMPILKQAGAPLGPEDKSAFSQWVRATPDPVVPALFALQAYLEGDVLKKTLKDSDVPAPRMAKPMRARL